MALFAHSFNFNGTSSETFQLRLVGFAVSYTHLTLPTTERV